MERYGSSGASDAGHVEGYGSSGASDAGLVEEHNACFSGCFVYADDVSGTLALVWCLQPGSGTGE